MASPLFPVFADLRGRAVLVVGGGAVAARKTAALLEAGARVRVGAPALDPSLVALVEEGRIDHLTGPFAADWLDDVWLAIAATGDASVNRAVAAAGEARRVWVNVPDNADASSVHVPAQVERAASAATLGKDTGAAQAGSVVLVGAGPGDPGLLTLRALRALDEADVILHDRLVAAEILRLGRRDARRIEVGKQAGHHHTTQAQIHALMLEHARAGRRVVRLKGGDPFVFGRGGEELEFLRAHGIAYEVVPGITAALACAAYAGIPLTHRDHAQSVRLVTAHCKDSLDTLDWRSLAQERQTLAVYMGVAGLEQLRDRLVANGRDPATPFALVENGSRAQQRVVVGPLSQLAERAQAHAVQSPALLIVGEVAALADSLHWFGAAPLGADALARAA